jgi:hypothetical protein
VAGRHQRRRIDQGGHSVRDLRTGLISIKQGDHTIVEFPLTVGVVGAAFAPTLAAVGAIAALVSDCTMEIERDQADPAAPALTDEAGKPLMG